VVLQVCVTLFGPRNGFLLSLQSRYWNMLLQSKLNLIGRQKWPLNNTLFILEGKGSKFHAFFAYVLVVYVNKEPEYTRKNSTLSKTTYTLNHKHPIYNVMCFRKQFLFSNRSAWLIMCFVIEWKFVINYRITQRGWFY
jgi:hypothetical protein